MELLYLWIGELYSDEDTAYYREKNGEPYKCIKNCEITTYNYKDNCEVTFAQFFPYKSKAIIDEIDTVLAEHYGFTAEELDFIINYDIKYRMGKELENGEGE